MASSVKDTLLYKLLLIGDTGVGKTCMIVRYVDETFQETFVATIGIDYKLKTLEVDGKRVKLQIWDTAGQERFHSLRSSYYKGAVGIMLVYDITEEKSFDNITKWLRDIKMYSSSNVQKLLVGNKCDLESERVVPYERGKQLAEGQNIGFIETNGKTNHNINEAFDMLVKQVVKKNIPRRQDSSVELQQQTNVKKCSCW